MVQLCKAEQKLRRDEEEEEDEEEGKKWTERYKITWR
jgi:hypothetical protein